MSIDVRALLISTYDLGRQPFGLASPAAWLRREGVEVTCADLSKEKMQEEAVSSANLIAFHLPMHTATRLAAPVIRRVARLNPAARVCAFGLYAPLNERWLKSLGVHDVLGGEFEEDLAEIVRDMSAYPGAVIDSAAPPQIARRDRTSPLPRLRFLTPDRSGLLPLSRYAMLHVGDGSRRMVGYTEASRGCKHLCRHCPVVPVYEGQFRVVQEDVVLADIHAQVDGGAGHITFGDPDFFNGPTHAMRIVDELHRTHPNVTYDVTIKVEHLLRHRHLLPRLRETGCLFVTSAVESLDDRVLGILDKGHTRQDFIDVVALCREASLTLSPTFVAFHPWTTLDGYCELLETLAALDLVDHVAPIQLAIRLLLPTGSLLLDVEEVKPLVGAFDERTLSYRWSHQDPRVDALQTDVSAMVGSRGVSNRGETFAAIVASACRHAGRPDSPALRVRPSRQAVPFLDEPWYCCAEPNPEQLTLV